MTGRVQISEDVENPRTSAVTITDVTFLADLSGALFWEEQGLLVVSDLHLEKGSSFAARGVLLPPYDTVATLSRLGAVMARHNPRMVIALGDMLSRIRGRIVHRELEHVSPLAVPVMLEIGRESVYGEASDELLAEAASELVKEATG